MIRLLRRLRALTRQSRIRLSPAAVARPVLAAGDRVEIGRRLWRVASARGDARVLETLEGPPARVVLRPEPGAGGWLVEDRGERVRLGPRDLIVYPVFSDDRSLDPMG